MTLKIPPPPQFTGKEWQLFNRWLIELQSILSSTGGIDPNSVAGLSEVITQSAANNAAIAALAPAVGGNTTAIAANTAAIAANTAAIATINGQITSLSARNQVFNGVVPPVTLHADGDYFVDTAGKHLYVQVAAAWVLIL